MASVWIHDKLKRDKVRGHMKPEAAVQMFEQMLREWCGRGGTHKRVDALEALLYDRRGTLRCGLYVEMMSPPTAQEPGQPKRKAAA